MVDKGSRLVKIVEGNFGKKEKDITTSEFLAAFSIKALEYEQEGKEVKVAVVMYKDGEVFEVAANEQYPDGVYMLLNMAAHAIINETLGITGVID